MSRLTSENIKKALLAEASGLFKRQPVLFAYLYGSFATGLVHPFSDIDIAVYITEDTLADSLEIELSLSLQIDRILNCEARAEVRIINNLPLTVKGKIVTEGIRLYSADEVERVNFEKCVLGAYFDFRPVIEEYQRIYFRAALS